MQTLKKFHPGFYLQDKSASTDPAKLTLIPDFTGAFVDIPWAALEPDRDGDYDFSLIRKYLDWGATNNRQLIFMLADRDFSRSASTSRIVPKWVASVPFNAKAGNRGCVAKIWTEPVNSARIALIRAIAREFDSHPNLEAISLQETALGGVDSQSQRDYSHEGYTDQICRLIREVAPAMPTTQLWQSINWLTKKDTYLEAIAQTLYETGAGGFTLPDNVPWEPDKLMYGVVKRWADRVPVAFGGDTSQHDKPGGAHYATFADLLQMQVDFALSNGAHYIMLNSGFTSHAVTGGGLSKEYGAAVGRMVAGRRLEPPVPSVLRPTDGEEPGPEPEEPVIDVALLRQLIGEGEGWLARLRAAVG
jgi:hypothetical protein